MCPRRVGLVAITIVILGSAFVVLPTSGSPPPVTVCDPCGHTFPVETVEQSTAEVRVHENGTATWTVRNWMVEDDPTSRVDRLRGNGSFVDQVARESLERSYAFRDAVLLTASMSPDDVVTMRFRTSFAIHSFGVLRVEHLRAGYRASSMGELGADRVTIIPPEGYSIASGVSGAETAGQRLELTSFTSQRTGPFAVFAPPDSGLSGVRTAATIGAVIVPRIVSHGFWMLLAAGILAGLLWIEGTIADARLPDPTAGRARLVAGALVVVGTAVAVASRNPDVVGGLGSQPGILLATGIATVILGLGVVFAPVRLTMPWQSLLVLFAVALGGLSAQAARGLVHGTLQPSIPFFAVATVLFGVPAGYAIRHGMGRMRLLGVSLAGLTFVTTAAWVLPLLTPPGQFYGLLILLLVFYAVVAAVVAAPFVALGVLLPAAGDA